VCGKVDLEAEVSTIDRPMTATLRFLAAKAEDGSDPELTFDAPRIVIGRSAGCEVLLADPTVSARHASIRQRGSEHVIVDEGSTNGILVGKVKLPAHTPSVVRSGDIVRIGRVWIELCFGVGMPSPPRQSEALARRWVAERLAADGEEPFPTARVVSGPDEGACLVLREPEREYVIGRSVETDWALSDDSLSRRHLSLTFRGTDVLARDLGSKRGTSLNGAPLSSAGAPWRPGQQLQLGHTELALSDPLPEALGERLRAPDERMRPREFTETPPGQAQDELPDAAAVADPGAPGEDHPEGEDSTDADGVDGEQAEDRARADLEEQRLGMAGAGFPLVEVLVALVALAVLGASVAGLLYLLRG
jgi:pSer/pThr/pTyr-binding forkhead associated (FHA) protein